MFYLLSVTRAARRSTCNKITAGSMFVLKSKVTKLINEPEILAESLS